MWAKPGFSRMGPVKADSRVFLPSPWPKKMGAETAEANMNAGLAAATQIVGYLRDGINEFQVNK